MSWDTFFQISTDSYLLVWAIIPYVMWLNAIDYLRSYRRWKKAEATQSYLHQPSTVIWAAVKGIHPHYGDHLNRLVNQNYPDYRIVFAIESKKDPAFSFLRNRFGLTEANFSNSTIFPREDLVRKVESLSPGLTSIQIVIAGESTNQGQKIQNLLAAFKHDHGYGDVIAFVDADALWEPDTLKYLVDAVLPEEVGLSTGYRWLVPEENSIPSILAASINTSIATMLGPRWRNSGWGGAMAIKRATFENLKIDALWKGKVNDDCSLSRLIKKHNLLIEFCPGVTPVTLVNYNWESAIQFGRRQYSQIWVFRRILWFYGVSVTSLHMIGWFLCFYKILEGQFYVILFLILLNAGEILRGLQRKKIARNILPFWTDNKLKYVYLWDICLTSISMAVHGFVAWRSTFAGYLTWSGIRYRMSEKATEVLSRNGHH